MSVEIITSIPLELRTEQLLAVLGRKDMAERFREDAEWAIEQVARVCEAKAVLDDFAITARSETSVTLSSQDGSLSAKLNIGSLGVELLESAELVQLSFLTFGDAMSQLSDEVQKEGDIMRHYILDAAAVLMMAGAGDVINERAEEKAAARGWGVGRRISPGDLNDWSILEQLELGSLVPVEQIGMQIREETGLLTPLKSASALIGMGPGYSEGKVGTICRWCKHTQNCLITRSRAAKSE